MASLNKVFLIGNLGKDPEMRATQAGDPIASFSLATSRKLSNGTEEVEWHRCVAFKKTAEIAGKYLKKGHQCHVEGMIRTRKWKDENGADKQITEIIVSNLILLSNNRQTDGGQQNQQQQRTTYAAADDDMPF